MHTFKSFLAEATDLTDFLKRGGKIKVAKPRAAHGAQSKQKIKVPARHMGDMTPRKGVKEEVQLDELKSSTLGRYIKRSADDLQHQSNLSANYRRDYPGIKTPVEKKLVADKNRRLGKRRVGIHVATNKLVQRAVK